MAELRRRRVIRVVVFYSIAGWATIQVASTVLPGLNVPPWSVTLVIVLVALGLPLAAVLAWAFDVNDGRIRKEDPPPAIAAAVPDAVEQPVGPSASAATADGDRRSVAVLPFVNLSGDPENEYFSDGISEEILNLLTKLPQLRVSSRTSSFAFKGRDFDIPAVAQRLGVGTVLEGSVRRAGDRVRITAQLIDTRSDSHLWSETYDRKFEDVFAIQDDIATSIVAALRVTLTSDERRAMRQAPTSNPQAYDFYLRGRSYYNSMTKHGFTHALALYQEAIGRDPEYALAYVGIADVNSYLYKYGGAKPEFAERALAASRRAVELDGTSAEAHTSLGLAQSINGRHEDAEREFERAIELNPSLYEAWYSYGRDCISQGNHAKAARLFARAVGVDPDSYEAWNFLASAYRKIGAVQPANDADSHAMLTAKRHVELYPDDARAWYLGAMSLAVLGDSRSAIEWAEHALAADPGESSVAYNVACMYSLMGNKDRAIALLEEAVRLGFGYRAWLEQDADLDPLRDDARFQAVLGRVV